MLGNQLKKPAQSREIILAAVGILVVSYLAFTNFVVPFRGDADSLVEQLEKVRGEADAIAKFNDVIRQNQKQQIGSSVAQQSMVGAKDLRIQLIQRNKKARYGNIMDFLEEVTSPVFRSMVSIDSLKYDTTVELSGYNSTHFEIVLNGRFPRVINFIRKLEGVEALLTLETIEIISNKTDTFTVTLRMGGTYYQLQDGQV